MGFSTQEGRPGIEETGLLWITRRLERGRVREELPIRIVRDTAEYRRILSLPALSGRRYPRPAETRVDELGIIYPAFWRPKDVFPVKEEGQERLTIKNPQNFTQIRARGERNEDLANLLKVAVGRRGVAELIFNTIDSNVETAIRQQLHILENYKPGTGAPELEQVKRVISFTQRQTSRFIEGGLKKDDLEDLLAMTTSFLEKTGLLSARIYQPEKEKMRERLLWALRPDKLARVNYLVSRVRFRSALINGFKRLVGISMIIEKAEDNLRLLSWERETTRWVLEIAAEDLAELAGLEDKRGHVAFWKEDEVVYDTQVKAMIRVLENIVGKRGRGGFLSVPRVVDYVGPAKLAAINLLGVSAIEDVDLACQIVGSDKVVNEFLRLSPVPVLLYNRKFAEARERVRWSHGIINAVLADYASIGKVS